jgi:hypothetical protein
MKEFLKWFFVFVCGLVLVNAGFMYAMYTIDKEIRSKPMGPLPTPAPEVVVKPYDKDPLMENMELLRLEDLKHCPRHYIEMQLKGAEFWMHQETGKVYTKDKKGKLVNAL